MDNHYKNKRNPSKKSNEDDLGIQVDNTTEDIFE
jgi:hypothetical protein